MLFVSPETSKDRKCLEDVQGAGVIFGGCAQFFTGLRNTSITGEGVYGYGYSDYSGPIPSPLKTTIHTDLTRPYEGHGCFMQMPVSQTPSPTTNLGSKGDFVSRLSTRIIHTVTLFLLILSLLTNSLDPKP